MGGAVNEPHPLSDIAPRAPLLKFLEITPAHTYKIPNRWYGKSLLRKVGQGSLQLPYNLTYRRRRLYPDKGAVAPISGPFF